MFGRKKIAELEARLAQYENVQPEKTVSTKKKTVEERVKLLEKKMDLLLNHLGLVYCESYERTQTRAKVPAKLRSARTPSAKKQDTKESF